jgi:hypothetical protein
MHAEQQLFPFASLDFAGRQQPLRLWEIATKLGVSVDHLLNEAEAGALVGIDLRGDKASRRNVRVPVESYRRYVLARMTGEFRRDFIRDLPRDVRAQLLKELQESFA